MYNCACGWWLMELMTAGCFSVFLQCFPPVLRCQEVAVVQPTGHEYKGCPEGPGKTTQVGKFLWLR